MHLSKITPSDPNWMRTWEKERKRIASLHGMQ